MPPQLLPTGIISGSGQPSDAEVVGEAIWTAALAMFAIGRYRNGGFETCGMLERALGFGRVLGRLSTP